MKKLLLILSMLAFVGASGQISQTFKNVTVNDTLKTASDSMLLVKAHLVPTSDSALDLGNDSLRWNKLYVDTVDANVISGGTYPYTYRDSGVFFLDSVVFRVDSSEQVSTNNKSTFIGWRAGESFFAAGGKGVANTLGGWNAGYRLFTTTDGLASSNTGWGHGALQFATTANYCTVGGAATAQGITTADGLTTWGYHSGRLTTFGEGVYLGYVAGSNGPNLRYNVFIGHSVGQRLNGTGSVHIGNDAAGASGSLQTTTDNTGVGYLSMRAITTGSTGNSVYGAYAGQLMTTASRNIWMGERACSTCTTVDSSIVIGVGATTSTTTVDNEMNIGNGFYATGLYRPSVKFGINNSAPSFTWHVSGTMGIDTTPAIAVGAAGVSLLVTDATTQVQSMPFAEGVYLPVDSAGSNVDGVTPDTAFYTRVGNVVTVSGVIEIDPTTTLTPTFFYMNVPVFPLNWNTNRAGGTFAAYIVNESGAVIMGGPTSVLFQFNPTGTGANIFSYTYSYRIE